MNNEIEMLEDEEDGYSFRRLLNILVEHKELIITINKDDEHAVKRNLTALKSRDASKLKSAGIEPGDEMLSYTSNPVTDDPDKIVLHVRLGPRKSVKIHDLKLPDNNF